MKTRRFLLLALLAVTAAALAADSRQAPDADSYVLIDARVLSRVADLLEAQQRTIDELRARLAAPANCQEI